LKTLRAYILTDTLLLALLGLGPALFHPGSFPVVYLQVDLAAGRPPVGLAAAGLGALALVLWLASGLPLVADRRRLALGLGSGNLLVSLLAFAQPLAGTGMLLASAVGLVFLGLAAGLAWEGLRPPRPGAIAAEIAARRFLSSWAAASPIWCSRPWRRPPAWGCAT
jgi:hypothetical protein